jgi:hypothetical protein
MKKLNGFFLASLAVIASFASVHAMELFVEEHEFLKSSIADIQNEAKDLMQDANVAYMIVTQPILLEECLKALGLSMNSTPVDVRYHYELMKQKNYDGMHNIIAKVYNQLIVMLSEIEKYRPEVEYLLKISFEELQTMEFEDKENFMHNFLLDSTNVAIDKALERLEKQYRQHIKSKQISNQSELPIILQKALKLPGNASPHMVDERYHNYIEINDPNKLIAHARMKNIPTQRLKDKLIEVEKVRQAYEQYLQKRGQ